MHKEKDRKIKDELGTAFIEPVSGKAGRNLQEALVRQKKNENN